MTRHLLAVLAVAACDSSNRAPAPTVVAPAVDAAIAAGSDAFIEPGLATRLEALAPNGKPPPALKRRHRSGDCSTSYAPRPDRDPTAMCRVRGGTFQMGGVLAEPPANITSSHSPPRSVTVRDFDIDQFEVTAGQAALFLNTHGNDCPGLHAEVGTPKSTCVGFDYPNGLERRDASYVVRPGHEHVVIDSFSFEGAMRYCAWVGKQLASSAQWEYAARHDPATGQDLIYPWGNSWRTNHSCTLHEDCPREWKRFGGRAVAGLFDGTRGRGDGSSPHGVHDTLETGSELVFVCASADETCHAGTPCSCRLGEIPAQQFDPAFTTTYARVVQPFQGAVRCVVPRDD